MRFHWVSPLATSVVALLASACSGGTGPASSNDLGTSTADLGLGKVDGAVLPDLVKRVQGSTVPQNGDLNPYGVAFVPPGFPKGGLLDGDDILVSNFNNKDNLQGTGTTIVRVNPNASPSLFFSNAGAPGFSTALGVLSRGFVLVGRVPSTDGSGVSCGPDPANTTPVNVGQGTIEIIDRHGALISTVASAQFLDGPWDLFVDDHGSTAQVYVSAVLTGTVTRLDFQVDDTQATVIAATQIASGYQHRCDPAAFLVGPTGLALDREREVLYVASTGDNAIFAVADATDRTTDAGKGTPVVTDAKHLHGPLGLARARNGDLIAAQGDAVNPDPKHQSEIVEFTATGKFVAEFSVDPDTAGAAFGLALDQRDGGDEGRFAAVEDDANMLDIWNVR
jgi:hypothetical protein